MIPKFRKLSTLQDFIDHKLKDRLDLTRAEPTLGTTQIHSPLDFPFNCSEIKKGIKKILIIRFS
jgi:hypothetical protein